VRQTALALILQVDAVDDSIDPVLDGCDGAVQLEKFVVCIDGHISDSD
jgi:hypothetical protein